MSTFKIGDRVRIVGATICTDLIGRQATITSALENAHNYLGMKWVGHCIFIDDISPAENAEMNYCFRPEYLAPILPSPELSEMTYAELMLSLSGERDMIPVPELLKQTWAVVL